MSVNTTTLFATLQELKLPIPPIPIGPHKSLSDVTERAVNSIPTENRFKRAIYDPQLVPKLVEWLRIFLGDTPVTPAVMETMEWMRAPKLNHPWEENATEAQASLLLSQGVLSLVSAVMLSLHEMDRVPTTVKVTPEAIFEGLKPNYTLSSRQDPPKHIILEAKHPGFMDDVGSSVDRLLKSTSHRGCEVPWKLDLPTPMKLLLKCGMYMILASSRWAFVSSHNNWLVTHLVSSPEPYLVVSPHISLSPTDQSVLLAFISAMIMTMRGENIEVPIPDTKLSPIGEADEDETCEDWSEKEDGNGSLDPDYEDNAGKYPKGPHGDQGGDPPLPAGRHTRQNPTGPLYTPLDHYLSAAFHFPHHDELKIFKLTSVGAPINPLVNQGFVPATKPQLEILEEIGNGALSCVFKALLFGSPVVAKIVEVTSSRQLWKQDHILREYQHYLRLGDKKWGRAGESVLGVIVPKCYGIYKGKGMHVLLLSREGAALESWSQLNSSRRTKIFNQICVLHVAGLKHGDVEPRNVLLRENGESCIIDLDHAVEHRCKDLKRLQGYGTKTNKWRCSELQEVADALGLSLE